MADERWVDEVASPYLWDTWKSSRSVSETASTTVRYVSEEVANLALKHHWQPTFPRHTFRVARVR